MTRCPICHRRLVQSKSRRALQHVPEMDEDPTVERVVILTLATCPPPEGCGARLLITRVELGPEPTELRCLKPDPRWSQVGPK